MKKIKNMTMMYMCMFRMLFSQAFKADGCMALCLAPAYDD
ncbi:hypothetical protein SAMN02910298_00653 [Pseudobutyrivibrio sp. YE44]|nr:hypothetical protein SAMN02910298_00653 [Pseudobutyrivibrio sp. YE44]